MEATLRWLKQYVDFTQSASEIEELFTMAGTECEDMIPIRETGDTAFKFEITSNRPDCYGVLGLAREIAACLGTIITEPDISYKTSKKKITDAASIIVESQDLCPYYSAQLITGVKVKESPRWLLDYFETLSAVKSIRPINNIADITNFVMLECSQPLHAFDFDKLAEKRLIIRRAKKGEEIRAIDDKVYQLDENMCVIADALNPQCVGGVMGGKESEITEETTNILLECAYFDPLSIRSTSRKLGLFSDSSYRFERGVDPSGMLRASKRATKLILESAGGEAFSGIIEVGNRKAQENKIMFKMPAIKKCLGIEVPAEKVEKIFKGLGLTVKTVKESKVYEVAAPTFRRDLEREIDLVEEVGRIHGYDKIPITSKMPFKSVKKSDFEKLSEIVKDIAVGAGYTETFTDSFVPDEPDYQKTPWTAETIIRANNPIRANEGLLRLSLIQSLMKIRKFNQDKGEFDAKIFELSRVFLGKKNQLPNEKYVLTCAGSDYYKLKGLLEIILERLRINFSIENCEFDLFEAGSGSKLMYLSKEIGYFGKINSKVLETFNLLKECAVFELDFAVLLELWNKVPIFAEMPRFPSVKRELAIIIDNDKTWQDLKNVVKEVSGNLLREIEFLEEYSGKPIQKGQKQYTFWMKFQDENRSLTAEEINKLVEVDMVNALNTQLGATLRK